MKEMEFTVSDIKDLMNAFSKNKLGSMEIVQGGFSLKLEAGGVTHAESGTVLTQVAASAAVVTSEPEKAEPCGNIVKSPIVGTFYSAPAPDKAPFVKVGSDVKKGDVLFIIESMKLMNEVTSDFDGTVTAIFAQNGSVVEYGQPVISIEPA